MVSPILEGIVVTCHINRAVRNKHLSTNEAGAELLAVALDLSALAVSIMGSDSYSNVVFIEAVANVVAVVIVVPFIIVVGTLVFGVTFIFWYYSHCFGLFFASFSSTCLSGQLCKCVQNVCL